MKAAAAGVWDEEGPTGTDEDGAEALALAALYRAYPVIAAAVLAEAEQGLVEQWRDQMTLGTARDIVAALRTELTG